MQTLISRLMNYIKLPSYYYRTKKTLTKTQQKYWKSNRINPNKLEKSNINPIEILAEANKYLFIQEYDNAARELANQSYLYLSEPEVHFRRIEVAWRLGNIEPTLQEYKLLKRKYKNNMAINLGYIICKLRCIENTHQQKIQNIELVNPSLFQADNQFELGQVAQLQLPNQVSPIAKHQFNTLGEPYGISESFGKFNKTLRISRHPNFPDDKTPQSIIEIDEQYADLEIKDTPKYNSKSPMNLKCVVKSKQMALDYPKNYATWYVLGCTYEFLGSLSDAIGAWNKSFELNNTSLATLANLAELQQMGVLSETGVDFTHKFEELDKYLVHGSIDTHLSLYKEYLSRNECDYAIVAIRTLADWMQKQKGEVPPEVEILCILGAMKAYEISGNTEASNACLREAETLGATCVRSNVVDGKQLFFIGELSEQFGLTKLARLCFATIMTSPSVQTDLVVQTAVHIISTECFPSFADCLKIAYRNHKGSQEIRLCQVLCSLNTDKKNVQVYMERKVKIRELINQNRVTEAIPLLEACSSDSDFDAEIHYYLGELYSNSGDILNATMHFERMAELDYFNTDSMLRYLYFLLKEASFTKAEELALESINNPGKNSTQNAELHWVLSTINYAKSNFVEARDYLNVSLQIDPWSSSYLSLALRIYELKNEDLNISHKEITKILEELFLNGKAELNDGAWHRLVEHGNNAIELGYFDYAYLLAKNYYLLNSKNSAIEDFYVRAASSCNSRESVRNLLMLLNVKSRNNHFELCGLAFLAARIYCNCGEWELLEEWTDIAQKSGLVDKLQLSKLFEMEAIKLALQGKNLKRAQAILEAAIDVFESTKTNYAEAGILHGYLMVTQGELKLGLERMQRYMEDSSSIQSFYFWIKALDRIQDWHSVQRETIQRVLSRRPVTFLEKRIIEEIYMVEGTNKGDYSVALAS